MKKIIFLYNMFRDIVSIIMPDEIKTDMDLYVSLLITRMVQNNLPIHIYGENSKMYENNNTNINYVIYPNDDVNNAFKNYYFTIVYENIDYFKRACQYKTKCLFYSRTENLSEKYGYDNVIQLYGDADEDLNTILHIINNSYDYAGFTMNDTIKELIEFKEPEHREYNEKEKEILDNFDKLLLEYGIDIDFNSITVSKPTNPLNIFL